MTAVTIDPDAELLLPVPATAAAIPAQKCVDPTVDAGTTKLQHAFRAATACAAFVVLFSMLVANDVRTGGATSAQAKCNAELSNGKWVFPSNSPPQWNTNTCFASRYRVNDVSKCLAGARVAFVGDSTARAQYIALGKALGMDEAQMERHADKHMEGPSGIELSFYWDPFLNRTDVNQAPWIAEGGAGGVQAAVHEGSQPALVVFSAGHWFMRHEPKGFVEAIIGLRDRVAERHVPGAVTNGFSADGAVERAFIRPVSPVVESKLNEGRRPTLTMAAVDEYNAQLQEFVVNVDSNIEVPPYLTALYSDVADYTEDGLHYDDSVRDNELNLQLNEICNTRLFGANPAGKTTCCVDYSRVRIQQWVTLLGFAVFGGIAWLWRTLNRTGLMANAKTTSHAMQRLSAFLNTYLPTEQTSHDIAIIGAAVTYMLIVDRTSLVLKVNKLFQLPVFGMLVLAAATPGFATMAAEKDTTFLNRHQTDEWKGWMQLAILVYHYTGASSITPIYAVIRVMVASYLFMTGYGHFAFFYKKNTYTFARAASVLVRLNVLSAAMAYTMDKDILFYYFGPLVSFWFIFVWLTMYVGNQHNKSTPFLLVKIAIGAGISTAIVKIPWCLDSLFELLNVAAKTNWDARESMFRLRLDHLVVYAGMLTAFAAAKLSSATIAKNRMHAIWASTAVFAAYAVFVALTPSKIDYNSAHPYVSPIVVVAFTILRNATSDLRTHSSRFFRWVGLCSLELFLVQYHVWLAVDTKGIASLPFEGVLGSPGVGMLVFGVIFVAVASLVAGVSQRIVDCIAGASVSKWRTFGVVAAMVLWNWAW
ncbi:hypothetical protein HDU87_006524 [Geranomyces variabilis]|uniref:Cas1p 10 TM acyl transferase domain-containing protein n=1 Tax=Geranomyces variabilis TaxID=109894 RepID=A0AAD5XKA9_9FUNG|nr:hypothetical protein HDU87_006524 [Geranomyces variabilis]